MPETQREEAAPAARPDVADRLRLFNFTRRDDHVGYLWVLRAMDRLRAVHQVQVDPDGLAEVLAELATEHREVPRAEPQQLRARLDALAEDGMLHRLEDASRAGSLARYRNRQSVYQFSELGYRAFTAVEDVLAAQVKDANLSRLVFPDVLDDLRALAAANATGDARAVHRRLARLDGALEDMARRSARFHLTLAEIIRSTETSPTTFLRYKNALLTHMSDFTDELDRHLPGLARAVADVEATGVETLLERAAEADERPLLDHAERLADWRRRWTALRSWFAAGAGDSPRVAEARAATRVAVSGVIALLRQITEARRGGVDRSTQLRHLAGWVFDTPDEDAARALMSAAFNLRSARHLGVAHEDAEDISPRATWWQAPGVEVSMTLFQHGRTPTAGVPRPARGNPGARARVREEQAAHRATERAAAHRLRELGAHDRPLDESETRVLLRLLTRALESRSVVAGRLGGAAGGNEAVTVRLVPSATGSVVHTAHGVLRLPGLRLDVARATASARAGAR